MTGFTRRMALFALVAIGTALVGAPAAYALPQPTLVSTTPAAGSTVQPPATVRARYDVALAPTSTITVKDKNGDAIAGTQSFASDDALPGNETIVFTPTSPLTQAGSPYTATATVRDAATNSGPTVTNWTFSVDTTAPAAPVIASVEGDTTSPGTGNDATPTIVVSGVTAGDTVTIKEGDTVLGSKVVPGGATTVTFNAAETGTEVSLTGDGDHSLTATAADPLGNTSATSDVFVYHLDTGTTAPTLVSTSPAAGSTVRPPAKVSATFSEPLSPASTISLRNQSGNVVSGTKSFSPDGRTIEFTPTSTLSQGGSPYTATVAAKDVNNNPTTANTVWTFTIDTTAPAVPTIASVEGDTTSPASGNDLTPTVVVSGVSAGDTVAVMEGDVVRGSKVVPGGATSVTFNAAETDTEVTVNGNGPHTLTATATDPVSNVSAASAAFGYTLEIQGQYRALTPARILDTRTGVGAPAVKIGPGQTREVQVTGQGGVPATGVSAVVINVTVTEPTTASHLTAYPTGQPQPVTSNLNFVAGQTVPNLVMAKVGADGKVSVFNNLGTSHVIFDVVGWYSA